MNYVVTIGYDETERRYYVLSSDIQGLNIEANSFEEFVEIVQDVAADLIGAPVVGSHLRIERQVALA